jgi:lactoylglutathione lyase
MSSTAIFDHAGISVLNLDRAVAWYGQALELDVEFEFSLPTFDFRGVMMLSPTGYRIELLERQGSRPGPKPDNPVDAALTQGFGHICLDVENVKVAYAELIAAGAVDRMSPRSSPEPGVQMAYVADPEGNLIELLDRAAVRSRGGVSGPMIAHIPIGAVDTAPAGTGAG